MTLPTWGLLRAGRDKSARVRLCGTDLHVHHGVFPLQPRSWQVHEPTGEVVELERASPTSSRGPVGVFWNQKAASLRRRQGGRPDACAAVQTWITWRGNSELMLAWASGCALCQGSFVRRTAPIFSLAIR